MQSNIVVHFTDGRLLKGHSSDLVPNRPSFHLTTEDAPGPLEVRLEELKAVFFVKSLEGGEMPSRRYELERPGLGRRIRVRFKDGETIVGYTNGYSPERVAFFVFPPDPEDNNQRILVVNRATEEVSLL